jgi:hypothetical protein
LRSRVRISFPALGKAEVSRNLGFFTFDSNSSVDSEKDLTPKRLQLDSQSLDGRLLWSEAQKTLHGTFERLVGKCEQVKGTRGCVLVTTGEVREHCIAVFNLAMAHSFSGSTMLVDATRKALIQTELLQTPLDIEQRLSLVSNQFMLLSTPSDELFSAQWPSSVNGLVGEHMFALMNTTDAFKLDWSGQSGAVVVIALATPAELEEERWHRLAELVGNDRFLGLWVVD